jgi:tetratricopeptide (TPR) repeat protein
MKVKRQLEGVPHSEQDLMMETMLSISCLGSVYYSQKKYTEARPILEVALDLRLQKYGAQHIDTAETMNSLGILLSKTARGNGGSSDGGTGEGSSPRFRLPRLGKKQILAQEAEAERLLKTSLVVRKRHLGAKHVEVSNTIFELIEIAVRQDRKGEAIPLLEECLEIRSECLGENHPYTEETLVLLSKLREEAAMRDDTQWALCVPLYERILALRDAQGMEDRVDTMEVLDALAGCLKESGREPEAIQYWERALAMTERMFPMGSAGKGNAPHPRTASLLNNLAVAHRQAGRDDKAQELWQKDLAICEATVGPNHPDTAVTLNNLAGIHKKRGMRKNRNEDPKEYAARMSELHTAKKMYKRALSIRSKVLPPQDPRLALTMHSLAAVYKEMKELREALPLLQDALEIQAAALGPEHPETQATKKHLAQLYNRLKPKTVTISAH